jgi:ABC-type multidrug transport system fused ATPase/permease subunit
MDAKTLNRRAEVIVNDDSLVPVQENQHRVPIPFKSNPISYILYLWYGTLLRLVRKLSLNREKDFSFSQRASQFTIVPTPPTDSPLPPSDNQPSFLLSQGYRRTIEYSDLFDTPHALKTKQIYEPFWDRFQHHIHAAEITGPEGEERLKKARKGETSRFLLKSILGQHKIRLIAALILQLFYAGIGFVGPLMLNQITKFLTTSEQSELSSAIPPPSTSDLNKAYIYAAVMFIAPVIGTVAATMANRLSIGTSIMIRGEMTASIYRKALRLSTKAKQEAETGRIVNLMSADVNQVMSFFYPFGTTLLTGPIILITALILLWFQIEWATFIGLGILLISTPATSIFVKKLTQYRRQMLVHTDQRVKLMNQLLVGIRVLKIYAWEAAQEAAILEVRKDELGKLKKAIPMRVGMQTLLFAAPTLAMVSAFAVYGTVKPEAFTPAAIFTSIALFGLMRFPLIFLPFALVQLSNALVSMRRLTGYFMLEDRVEEVHERDSVGIEVQDGSFFWPEAEAVKKEEKKGKKGKKVEKIASQASNKAENTATTNGYGSVKPSPFEATTENGSAAVQVKLPSMTKNSNGEGDGDSSPPPTPGNGDGKKKSGSDAGKWWLRNVNLEINKGELVCVVGKVGSGKSSLVSAILGEMQRAEGKVAIGGTVAYASQQAWIINATVKKNVTFGTPFDQSKWEAAVDACCLKSDLEILPGGEDTEIGEKGINLSGGQKQRVSLARAMYADADVYILDDPLSAVDVHVGKHIFENFINGAIKEKARLLVTNQLQYVHNADKVIVLDAGNIVAQGSYEECAKNEMFARLLNEHNSSAEVNSTEETHASTNGGDSKQKPQLARTKTEVVQQRTATDVLSAAPGALGRGGGAVQAAVFNRAETFARNESAVSSKKSNNNSGDDGKYGKKLARFETMARQLGGGNGKTKKSPASLSLSSKKSMTMKSGKGALMVKEDQEVGQITGKVYGKYITAYGIISFFALVILWSSEQAVRILTNWWLSRWTNAEVESQAAAAAGEEYSFSRIDYIGGYLGFAFGFVFLTGLRSTCNLLSALRASRVIHERTLGNLVRAPVAFFDTTPVGRILNRFSKDTDDVDFLLSMSMTEFGNCIMQLLATLIFIAVIQPWILVGIAPLSIIYYFLQKFFRKSNIELQRLDAVSRSPIYAHFSESLSGVETIRAYGLAEQFALASDSKVDTNHRAYFCVRMANEWLSLRLDVIGATVVFLTAILSIVRRDTISAALAALTLSEALDVTAFLKAAVTSGAMFETRFNSVERLIAYWELPQEAPAHSDPGNQPPDDWPTQGMIEYNNVCMKYRPELDPVLKGVSFVVEPGDKVGIVGRTGSGKSSLIVTLFRVVEPYAGTILLDGLNILDLGLEDVRSRIAAIPQDPVLFSGSIRSNLDPYDKHNDAELWDALGHVALKEVVGSMAEGLSSRVTEGGDNFSVGQRQLLCVARALLRQPRVLVADEATASVDSETDALIQRTIRREFKSCTVLTIAHRLNTVLDSTRVLVMEDGLVKEYDTVPNLMGNRTSTFRSMVMEAGLESPSLSRAASAADLAEMEANGKKKSFMSRMKDIGLN